MKHDFTPDLSNGLVEDLLETIYAYSGTLCVATVVGCLEVVKSQIIEDHVYGIAEDEMDDPDEEDKG